MFIKEVLTYDWNYAEYIVSDGYNELICMCLSVPLPSDLEPKIGMKIKSLEVFSYKDLDIELVDSKVPLIRKGKYPLEYILTGEIINNEKALIKIGNFVISLANDFSNGFPNNYENGCFIKFKADRIDSALE